MGHRGRESAKQQSGAPGAVQHSAVGPARLAQGPCSTEAVQVLESQTPGSRSRMCDAPRAAPAPPPTPVGPEPGTASHGHRLGSQQGLLND